MMREQWLCRVKVKNVKTRVDLRGVETQFGDFVPGKLSLKVNVPERNELIVDVWKGLETARKSTLVFGVDIAHVESLASAFRKEGVAVESLTSNTPREERAFILQMFREGKLDVLVNCGILTEGTGKHTILVVIEIEDRLTISTRYSEY